MTKVIGLIAGSLRKESFSKKLAKALVTIAPEGYTFTIISLDGLPVYNQDFDDDNEVPDSYTSFRSEVQALAGVVFITPEYNRSVPGVLKNALDVGSRPYGKSVWDGKPTAIISNSPGNLSGFGANHHLRQCLVFLNMPTMQQPEAYLSKIDEAFDEQDTLKEHTQRFLQKVVSAYLVWFEKHAAYAHESLYPT